MINERVLVCTDETTAAARAIVEIVMTVSNDHREEAMALAFEALRREGGWCEGRFLRIMGWEREPDTTDEPTWNDEEGDRS